MVPSTESESTNRDEGGFMARLDGFLEDDGGVATDRWGVRLSEDEDLCNDFFVALAGDCLAFSNA